MQTLQARLEFLRGAFRSSLAAKIGYLFARNALGKVRERLDPRRYNGAMFLGLNGVVVKSHGSATAKGVAHAVAVTARLLENKLTERIAHDLSQLGEGALSRKGRSKPAPSDETAA